MLDDILQEYLTKEQQVKWSCNLEPSAREGVLFCIGREGLLFCIGREGVLSAQEEKMYYSAWEEKVCYSAQEEKVCCCDSVPILYYD